MKSAAIDTSRDKANQLTGGRLWLRLRLISVKGISQSSFVALYLEIEADLEGFLRRESKRPPLPSEVIAASAGLGDGESVTWPAKP